MINNKIYTVTLHYQQSNANTKQSRARTISFPVYIITHLLLHLLYLSYLEFVSLRFAARYFSLQELQRR